MNYPDEHSAGESGLTGWRTLKSEMSESWEEASFANVTDDPWPDVKDFDPDDDEEDEDDFDFADDDDDYDDDEDDDLYDDDFDDDDDDDLDADDD